MVFFSCRLGFVTVCRLLGVILGGRVARKGLSAHIVLWESDRGEREGHFGLGRLVGSCDGGLVVVTNEGVDQGSHHF